jgi:hypothetical protein
VILGKEVMWGEKGRAAEGLSCPAGGAVSRLTAPNC